MPPTPMPIPSPEGAMVTQRHTLGREAGILPQISLVREDGPGTPET